MTSKQRVLATFRSEPTDRVPVRYITFSSRVASALLSRDAHVVVCSNLVMPETPMANVDAMISTLQSGVSH
jgi:uroporphyrinogen-III decarboxylase